MLKVFESTMLRLLPLCCDGGTGHVGQATKREMKECEERERELKRGGRVC